MSCVNLLCDYEVWLEYKKLFILLSRLRSLNSLNVFISSHTRAGTTPSLISDVLLRLKGLVAYLSNECSPEEQNKFFTLTLPFIAREANSLKERIPERGLPYLEKQENSALVLGRKVVLAILCNAFLCTFPSACGSTPFTFGKFFNFFLEEGVEGKKIQASKLRCILCYFERLASGKCNISGVITYRRQVLCKTELPKIFEWETNSLSLCPFVVDNDNRIEDSGGHTLQVSFSSLGGGVLDRGCTQEEAQFSVCPELLIAPLVMSAMDENEAVVITGTERFAEYSGFAGSFEFTGEYCDESERDVFGNLLHGLVALDTQVIPSDQKQSQYQSDSILRELNKAYVGFCCQKDHGDINTGQIALTAKRQSLAFVAEDYPDFCAPLNSISRQEDIGNIHITSVDESSFKIAVPSISWEPQNVPLSPIQEISESPNFSSLLANSILKSSLDHMLVPPAQGRKISGTGKEEGGVDALASKLADSILHVENSEDEIIEPKPKPKSSIDDLAFSLASSILKGSVPTAKKEGDFMAESTSVARSIISDVLSSSKDSTSPPISTIPPQTAGEPSSSSSVLTLASQLSNRILCDVVQTSTSSTPSPDEVSTSSDHPAIMIQEERRGSVESTTSSQNSSVQNSSVTSQTDMLQDYTDIITEEAVKEGLSLAATQSQSEHLSESSLADMDAETKGEVKKKLPTSLTRQGIPLHSGGHKVVGPPANTPSEHGSDLETPVINSRLLLTPMSSRVGYAWSIASTRDEDSRPVSPTDLDNIGLGLSKNTDEFSSLFSKIVISHAITNITGKTVSPQTISTEEDVRSQDLTSLPGSSKIGIFLSKLGEAEPPFDERGASYGTSWHKMRMQLLRPIATGYRGSGLCGEDPQVTAMIQWMTASACGRPRLFYYTAKEERMEKLAQVISHLVAMHWTVGQLCQSILTFGKQIQEAQNGDLFTFLLQIE